MKRDGVEARLNRRTKLWEVRLVETIAEATQEEAELAATVKLKLYAAVSAIAMSPAYWISEKVAAERDYWKAKYKELKEGLEK